MERKTSNDHAAAELPEAEDAGTPGSGHLLVMSLVSAMLYGGVAWVLFRFVHDRPVGDVLRGEVGWAGQAGAGVAFGVAAAAVIIAIYSRSPMREVLEDFAVFRFVSRARFTTFDRIQISAFAGAGEELLFRGALQPLIGIWWTSVIFVALHGYFSFRSVRHGLFGLTMFGLSVGLGLLFIHFGFIAAAAGHAVYDFIMLEAAQRRQVFRVERGGALP